jgi:2-keto-4-pentenoate hydratase/2-oxohepta-3-ene-1,7-dioic acid hydratase in catechol pathway
VIERGSTVEAFIRFELSGRQYYGRREGETVQVLDAPYWLGGKPTGKTAAYGDVRLICPVEPSKIILVGLNYHAHVSHSQSAKEAPKNPVLFLKPPSALVGPNDQVVYPDAVDRVDYEAELAVIIGKQGHKIPAARAADHIFGYTCLNDVTARHIQKQDGQWTRGKGFDTFCPIGPEVVRGIDVSDITVEAYLNGARKQHGRTSEMIFPIPVLIEFISSVMTLLPGDVISTGTPEGIDPMQRGDSIEVRIENVGSLVNTIV